MLICEWTLGNLVLHMHEKARLKGGITCCTAPAGGVPAWLAGIVKDTAAHEQHHKVKRRALQLAALPLLADRECTNGSQTLNEKSTAELEAGKSVAGADPKTGAQPSTTLEEIQALQKQLQDTQHPEVRSAFLDQACIKALPS